MTIAPTLDPAKYSDTAVKALKRLFNVWSVSEREAAQLVGIDVGQWYLAQSGVGKLCPDHLENVGHLLGVYRALGEKFGDKVAHNWPTLPNNGPLFNGKRPLDVMVEAKEGLQKVRIYVESFKF